MTGDRPDMEHQGGNPSGHAAPTTGDRPDMEHQGGHSPGHAAPTTGDRPDMEHPRHRRRLIRPYPSRVAGGIFATHPGAGAGVKTPVWRLVSGEF